MSHPHEMGASLQLAGVFAEATRVLPQAPFPLVVGAAALRLVESGQMTADAIFDFPTVLGERHFDILRAAVVEEHGPLDIPVPSDESQRRAAGFVMTSLLQAATQLSRGDAGEPLGEIPKVHWSDPSINTGELFLGDSTDRGRLIAALDIASGVLATDAAQAAIARYKTTITGISHHYRGVSPEGDPVRFGEKIEALNDQRRLISAVLGRHIHHAFWQARAEGAPGVADLTPHQLKTLAHNLTRWQPDQAWFRPEPA